MIKTIKLSILSTLCSAALNANTIPAGMPLGIVYASCVEKTAISIEEMQGSLRTIYRGDKNYYITIPAGILFEAGVQLNSESKVISFQFGIENGKGTLLTIDLSARPDSEGYIPAVQVNKTKTIQMKCLLN